MNFTSSPHGVYWNDLKLKSGVYYNDSKDKTSRKRNKNISIMLETEGYSLKIMDMTTRVIKN